MQLLALALLLCAIAPVQAESASSSSCRIIPGDAQWPSQDTWNAFNESVSGRLIRTVPLASPCHNPSYNADECSTIQANWHDTSLHEPSSSSVMSAVFSNRSCDPFDGVNAACIIGTYVEYSVNATSVAHLQSTVKFAKAHNIRFVVRNSGHDYMGKSTGHGALAIWTHYLTETEWMSSFSSSSSSYRGPAVKAQAGVSVLQIYEEASAHGYSVIGGACPSVGYTGGFIQGGGHGPLSSIYGMAADDVLSFEVVTTNGDFVTASATQNPDLFWALRGGGPGTYGIVWTVTAKAHPDLPVTGAIVIFSTSDAVTLDTWWKGVAAYRSITPNITAAGGYTLATYFAGYFALWPLLLPNKTQTDINAILKPFFYELTALGIPYTSNITSFPGYLQAYNSLFNASDFAIANAQVGGRLLPKSSWASNSSLTALNTAIKDIVNTGAGAYDISVSPGVPGSKSINNAIFAPWRETQATLSVFIPWDDYGNASLAHTQQQTITNTFIPSLKKITPTSGAYLNEADAFDPQWKQTFYGSNYAKLLSIKDKWDPAQMLYGSTAVGGDRWKEDGEGRLCRV